MKEKIGLSKSKYCKGFQCPKILWMEKYKPEEAQDTASESVLANGTKVGDLARDYFGQHVLVEFTFDKEAMVNQTKEFMDAGADVIAEASFLADGLYCAVDLLRKNGDGWDIIEVKSSTKVSDIYIEDMAFQNYVLGKAGVKVKNIHIMYINNQYVRHGDLNLQQLFVTEEFTDICKMKEDEVEARVAAIRGYVDTAEEPEQQMDVYCEDPYPCAFWHYCGKHIPEQSIFSISRLKKATKYKYYKQGIITYQDILDIKPKLNANQYRQVETAVNHLPDVIVRSEIKEFLDTLTYPIYHLDFETFQQAVPEFEGAKPYQQITFQYSLHIEHEDGTLEHKEFLGKEGEDPRRALAEQLIQDIPINVCSLAYNMSFEKGRLKELAETFPDLAEHLMNISDHMQDLMIPFQKQYYYTEAMQGSYSIKYVLPALCPGDPELDYHNLDGVHNGAEASFAFADMPNHSQEEIAVMRENLLKYCGLDTLAMVKVLEKLRAAVK